MLQWLTDHSDAIQTLSAVATAAIWIIYLQLILSGMRHQRRTEILILVGGGRGIAARCFVANLGMDPVYITSVTVRLHYDHTSETRDITDVQGVGDDAPAWQRTLQGPMKSGDSRAIGTLEDLLGPALEAAGLSLEAIRHFDLQVAAFTASDSEIVAAERGFRLEHSGEGVGVRPLTIETRQIRSLFARKRIRRQLRESL